VSYTIKRDRLGRARVDGPCVFRQTYCEDNALTIQRCLICKPYTLGKSPPNYPVPALASSSMSYALSWINPVETDYAWDGLDHDCPFDVVFNYD